MAWIAFEYDISKNVFSSKTSNEAIYPVVVKFNDTLDHVYITSIVSEIYVIRQYYN